MRVLIVGSSGFIGRHLARHLVACGHHVEGWGRRAQATFPGFEAREIDVLRPETMRAARGPWDAAVLLAAHAVPGPGFGTELALENVAMTVHALDHLAQASPGLRVLLMSSGHVYAQRSRACTEDDAPDPAHPYGVSKLMCEQWARAHRSTIDLWIVRSFQQIGPGMPDGLIIPDVLRALAQPAPVLRMHGSDSTRDFLDVRDGVAALERLLHVRAPSGSVVNLCSGAGVRISELARRLMELRSVERDVVFAGGAPDVRVGSPAKIRELCGWSPQHALDETLAWIVAAGCNPAPRTAT